MKNVKYLIKEARDNTNTNDKEAISNEWCINNLNKSLRYIVATLYNLNVRTKLLRKEERYSLPSFRNVVINLPEDIYAKNAIISLRSEQYGECPIFIDQIADKSRSMRYGYVVQGDTILVTGSGNAFREFVLTYAAKVPNFGLPFASINSIIGNTIEINSSDDLNELCERFSVVDINGKILAKNISFNQTGNELLTVGDISQVSIGNIIVPGEYSTTHCPLPEELDVLFLTMLEAFIMARQSSLDLTVNQAINQEYINTISELFSDNSVDVFVPAMLENSEWA